MTCWAKSSGFATTPGAFDESLNRCAHLFIGKILVLAPAAITVTIHVAPDTLNLKSKGKWISCYIELPEGYDAGDIDPSSLLLNATIPAEPSPIEYGDYDEDMIPDIMVKFDRASVQEILQPGEAIEITVSGELYDGTVFEGTDTIRVIDKGQDHTSADASTVVE